MEKTKQESQDYKNATESKILEYHKEVEKIFEEKDEEIKSLETQLHELQAKKTELDKKLLEVQNQVNVDQFIKLNVELKNKGNM